MHKNHEEIAQTCHELNKTLCSQLGDHSQESWDLAPRWQRESAIAGVEAICHRKTLTPEDSHKSWFEQKKAEGWTYGEFKNVDLKTHPCMVPFADLPLEYQLKDIIFFHTALTLCTINGHMAPEVKEEVKDKK